MLEHISFCLDEIECEIESYDVLGLSTVEQLQLREHIEQMRAVLDRSLDRRQRKQKPAARDDLTLIRGIDGTLAQTLRDLGVKRFAAIAAWGSADLADLGRHCIAPERISTEGWIEQAAILATGRLTHHARTLKDKAKPVAAPVTSAPLQSTCAEDVTLSRSIAEPANDAQSPLADAPVASRAPRHAAAVFLAAMLAGLQQNGLPGFN